MASHQISYIRQRLLENTELSLERAYQIARILCTAQKNSELFLQQSHQLIPTNALLHLPMNKLIYLSIPIRNHWLLLKVETLEESLATFVEDSYMLIAVVVVVVVYFILSRLL